MLLLVLLLTVGGLFYLIYQRQMIRKNIKSTLQKKRQKAIDLFSATLGEGGPDHRQFEDWTSTGEPELADITSPSHSDSIIRIKMETAEDSLIDDTE